MNGLFSSFLVNVGGHLLPTPQPITQIHQSTNEITKIPTPTDMKWFPIFTAIDGGYSIL